MLQQNVCNFSTEITEDRKSSKLNTSGTLEYTTSHHRICLLSGVNKETTDKTPAELR